MLVPAILYKAQIIAEFQKRFYTTDMFFETGVLDNWLPEISEAIDASKQQFAIVDNNKNLIGYFAYCIDWHVSSASKFGLISFDKGNPIVGLDVYKTIRKLLYKYKLHRIEFRMIGGNPVERHYDKICKHFGGTKYILKDVTKDRYGEYHNHVIYEIINKSNCVSAKDSQMLDWNEETKYNDNILNKSLMQYFNEAEITRGEILGEVTNKHLHGMGMNSVVEITEKDISALREGKIIMCDSGDFTDFLVMRIKMEANENENTK